MKKIFTLLDVNICTTGGSQYSSLLVMKKLKNEFDFTVITPGNLVSKEVNAILLKEYNQFPSILRSPIKFLRFCMDLKSVLKNKEVDVYHCQMASSFMALLVLKQFKIIGSTPIIFTDRSLFEDHRKLNKFLFKLMHKQISCFVTTSEVNYKSWKNFFEDKVNVKKIYNTSFDCFELYDKSDIHTDNQVIRIGFSGRYTKIKDWELVEEICIKLSEQKRFVFNMAIGILSEEDLIEVNKMKSRLQNAIGEERVNIQLDLGINDMPYFFSNCDIFISTSKKESFGRVAVEAMSQRTCVYGKRVGGLQEVIGSEDFLYSDINELLTKLIKLCESNSRLKAARNSFYDRYYKNYSIDRNIEEHRELYTII